MVRHPLIDMGSFPIYNVMAGIGLISALLVLMHNLKDYNLRKPQEDRLLLLLAIAFVTGMGLSNVGNWFIMPGALDLPLLLRIKSAGLSFYFGLIGFLGTASLLLKAFRYDVGKCLNTVVPSMLLFHGFGRIGCSLGGCCYGKIVNWNVFNTIFIERFPAREIEAILLFIGFFVTQYVIKERRLVFYLYAYPVTRFLLEFGRGDNRGVLITSVLSPSQIISVVIISLISVYFVLKMVSQHSTSSL